MLKRSDFISRKNYLVICFFNWIVKLLYLVSKLFFRKKSGNNKIIILELGHMGDVLTATPAIKLIKEAKKDAKIILVCTSSGALALNNNPYVDAVEIICTPPWYEADQRSFLGLLKGWSSFVKMLNRINGGTIINFRNVSYHLDHIAAFVAGIPHLVGYGNKGLDYLLTFPVYFNQQEPAPVQKVRLVSKWLKLPADKISLRPLFFCNSEGNKKHKQLIDFIQIGNLQNVVAINLGAQHNFLWPVEHYIQLCQKIHGQFNTNILFLGMSQHVTTIESIRKALEFKTYSLAGSTSLEDVYWILQQVKLLITVDTGIRHLANAAGAKVIVLRTGAEIIAAFGKYVDTEEVLFHPVSCSPCGKKICPLGTLDCMKGISVLQVFDRVVGEMSGLGLKLSNQVEANV
jgi:ADP-heptose:LPS heptosyltransferase